MSPWKIILARDPKQCVRVRSRGVAAESLDAWGSREVMVVMRVEIVGMVAVIVGGWVSE